ncbi:RNA polymerase sigma factor [Aureisphaera sp. CAU 1614]|uniref:RNA polymerase sigma factor n=1 Tax=Halomarinibacterium sedimenti TaxID=2857106 RepID=A0A9X1FNB9_9FLAO|nr:RNA polymerase sigma factor [Halomarinibacterium sedimenti]MBW2937750.1 RNA polymerase sigma factor [Halomarinibacterium sedimenti]
MTTSTDHQLINNTLHGNTQAFSVLVERYQNFVFTIAVRMLRNREEAEEVAQDSFIKAFEALSTYRGEAKFSSWLYSIVYRKTLDRIRKNNNSRTIELVEEITETETEDIENALHFIQIQERNELIKKGIEQLPEQEAAIITFFYFEELSIKEISEITQLSEDNVKIKLFRSRKKLFTLLKYYVLPQYTNNNGSAI